MARLARVVIPGCPHHVTQRGVRSMNIFRDDGERRKYLCLLKCNGARYGVRFKAYCLMSNHIHLVAVPERQDSLARAIGETHRLYTSGVNFSLGVRGYLFQGRFYSCPMDERHAISAIAYVERNPVRAGLACEAWHYRWSSAGFHSGMTQTDRLAERIDFPAVEWRDFLKRDPASSELLRRSIKTGWPIGTEEFLAHAEEITGRRLRPLPPGRKKEAEIGIVSPITGQAL